MAIQAKPNSKSLTAKDRDRGSARRELVRNPGSISRKGRRKFLRYYPGGFNDPDYIALERDYKWVAHERWMDALSDAKFRALLDSEKFDAIARSAVSIEARTNLLFSFEKMALRDAVKSRAGAKLFAQGLWSFLHSEAPLAERFETWIEVLARLPRLQTRVLTWPLATLFGFIAQPRIHFFMKPMVTRRAASRYGYDLKYQSRPDWNIYSGILRFARVVSADIRDLRPRDMIDLQSFIWVQGSDEYPD